MTPVPDERSSPFPARQKLARLFWGWFHFLFIRFSPRPCHGWRSMLLRLWGAKIGPKCHIYPRAIIWAPWNLECDEGSCIGDFAEIYNVARIHLGAYAVISQNAFLCTASHDYTDPQFPLRQSEIVVGPRGWVAARAIVLPGVTVAEGCVIGAGSVVTKSMPPYSVCAGNPCRVLKRNYNEGTR